MSAPSRPGSPLPEDPVEGWGEGAPLTVAAVAARLGVAASTLRTWDRRYGLGPTAHEAGSHRRYSPRDVARLERMRHLTLRGVAPADAARAALSEGGEPPVAPGPVAEEPPEPLLVDPLSLAAAALEPDLPRVERMLHQEVRVKGLVRTWSDLAKPALVMLAQRERSDRPGIDPEGLLQAAVLTVVREVAAGAERARSTQLPGGAPVMVLLYAGGEHRLRAHVIGGGLAERGMAARVLRAEQASTPDQVLQTLDARNAVALAVLGGPPGVEEIVDAAAKRGDLEIFLLGADAPDLWLPRVRRVRTTTAAVEEIAGLLLE